MRGVGTSYSMKRPFLNSVNSIQLKEIKSFSPIPFPNLWSKLHLRSLFFINNKLTRIIIKNQTPTPSVLEYVSRFGYPEYATIKHKKQLKQSYTITHNIFELIQRRYGDRTSIIFFSVHDSDILSQLLAENEIEFINTFLDINHAETLTGNRIPILRVDGPEGHFNIHGHKVLAESLASYFSNIGITRIVYK